jgi:hypothetical protein
MLIDFLKLVAAALLGISILAALASLIAYALGAVQTIRRRKPGVSFLRASKWINIVSSNDLYEETAQPWQLLHVRGFIYAWVFLLTAMLAGGCLKYLERLQQ